jgi:hypothetical protein
MNSWHSYPSIYNLGHRAIESLLTVRVNVEEKIDGSQFSFGVDDDGQLHIRSKGAQMHIDAPEKMFSRAAETVKEISSTLTPGWTYRAEYLAKPKHNSLCYSRIPRQHLIVFDVNTGEEGYLPYARKATESIKIGLEVVPLMFSGELQTIDQFRRFLDSESVLGGQKIEGVVVKPSDYGLFGADKKVLMGKFVSEHFKEVHSREWKKSNPTNGDVLLALGEQYTTAARWQKAVLHLQERGLLEGSPRDIGALIKEVPADISKECADEIKDKLFAWAWPHIQRMTTRGLPEWYKEQLLKQQFEREVTA